uniref:Uncharacterized protein n=1 Tax=Arundo donax TaxID=35708 RepID=A0A0A9C1W4_ARUDO
MSCLTIGARSGDDGAGSSRAMTTGKL